MLSSVARPAGKGARIALSDGDARHHHLETDERTLLETSPVGTTTGRLGGLGSLDLTAGADNLVRGCIGAQPGERLLVVREDSRYGFYDCTVAAFLADRARVIGLAVDEIDVGPPGLDRELPDDLIAAMAKVDHTCFFARIGDQLRFDGLPAYCTNTVSYAYDAACLGSRFGTTPYALMHDMKLWIDKRIASAREIRLTCPLGTDLVGKPLDMTTGDDGEVKVRRFPLNVFKPVPAIGFSGKVALSRWLVGSGSRYYEPYQVDLSGTVHAVIHEGYIVDIRGPDDVVACVQEHHAKVGEMFGIDPFRVHSWHAGIHPQTLYPLPAGHNLARWSALAFGSPRYLHFHVCGDDPPGEISWTVIDPTITLDGEPAWDQGRLVLAEADEAKAIQRCYRGGRETFTEPTTEIGL